MFKRLILAGLTSGAVALPHSAEATACAKRDVMVNGLQSKYSEMLTAGGLQNTRPVKNMVEVWSSPTTGTFTVILTNPSGISCVVATGTDWFQQNPEQTPAGQPS